MWVKWDQRKTGRRVSHLAFTFGEKGSKSPQKVREKKSNSGLGAMYGIPRTIIEANAKVGESYEDTALRLLEESKHSVR